MSIFNRTKSASAVPGKYIMCWYFFMLKILISYIVSCFFKITYRKAVKLSGISQYFVLIQIINQFKISLTDRIVLTVAVAC